MGEAVPLPRRTRTRRAWGLRLRVLRFFKKVFGHYRVGSITRRIFVINLLGLACLVIGVLYLYDARVKLIEARVESLSIQAAIISKAIAQAPPAIPDQPLDDYTPRRGPLQDPDIAKLSFSIKPEIAPILRELTDPTRTRARIYDQEGNLIHDSRPPFIQGGNTGSKRSIDPLSQVWNAVRSFVSEPDLPPYQETGGNGKAYEEVKIALTGTPSLFLRVTPANETVIQVAQPVMRQKSVIGALLLTDQTGTIDDLIAQQRWQVIYIAAFIMFITGTLSFILAGTIAEPMRRLALAAERVRKNIKSREHIPDFGARRDEIGYLSRALRDMTNALYLRIEAIGSFAADVSHELKNPLTSLRNAAGMLPKVKREEDRQQLIDIILHDVKRLDRLITDISDASRLDAELARETAKPVNVASLLYTLCDVFRQSRSESGIAIVLKIDRCEDNTACHDLKGYDVSGHGSRLGQVVTNLLDNAVSFSPKGGTIYVSARRLAKKNQIEITVEDEGPGIDPENFDKIFRRFYTDRPEPENFGQNSGLGLNISQQIVEAHMGRIWAENRMTDEPAFAQWRVKKEKAVPTAVPKEPCAFLCGTMARYSFGAKFIVRLPALAGT
jgi:two-component system sensor histidine kinase ChvG